MPNRIFSSLWFGVILANFCVNSRLSEVAGISGRRASDSTEAICVDPESCDEKRRRCVMSEMWTKG